MRILWMNWRDIKNPKAGGAEVFTHEIQRRLVKKGYDMTLVCPKFTDCKPNEEIDGVKIIRKGGRYSVYSKAKLHYERFNHDYDLVVDEINTRPFLTPKYVKDKPLLALIHQLAREFWFYETPFPLSYLGYYYLEKKWLSYYKKIHTITVSQSTKKDLESLGFCNVSIIPNGLNITPLDKLPKKESCPTLVFLGRLEKAKLPNHALQAFSIIKKKIPTAKMWIIGDGSMKKKLERYNIPDVSFFGYVETEKKNALLSKAHLTLVPGVREGWGLVVTESNAMGTPAAAYNVAGLRDSVRNGYTGILTEKNTPESLANSAIYLLQNQSLLQKLSSNALKYARQFDWDSSAKLFEHIIKNTV